MAQSLPNEILINIIEQCIEPFTLESQEIQSKFTPAISAPSIALAGLPQYLNLKLVNKTFYHNTWRAIKKKYDGNLTIARSHALRIALRIGRKEPAWLRPLVQQLKTTRLRSERIDHTSELLFLAGSELFPDLRIFHIQSSSDLCEPGLEDRDDWFQHLPTGEKDNEIIRMISEELNNLQGVIAILRTRELFLTMEFGFQLRNGEKNPLKFNADAAIDISGEATQDDITIRSRSLTLHA